MHRDEQLLVASGGAGSGVDPLIDVSIPIYVYRSRSSQVASKTLLNMANTRQG